MTRDFRRGAREQWSARNQTLRHAGEKRPRDDQALLHNPIDYSALGGPENERVYGRTRNDGGYYPWNPYGGPYDRDTRVGELERGGYLKQPFKRVLSPWSAADDRSQTQGRDNESATVPTAAAGPIAGAGKSV